jgi:hypothetical protein
MHVIEMGKGGREARNRGVIWVGLVRREKARV